jgi:quercetin dioxygenase-like cupin family protein
MNIAPFNFQAIDWSAVPKEELPGETGTVTRQVLFMGNIRVRRVSYSAGYKADHWCVKGHVLHCLEGEMDTALEDGRVFTLTAGMTYLVGDDSEPHRSSTKTGCELLIVD